MREVSLFGRREWLLLAGLAGPLLFAAYYAQGAILTGSSIRAERMTILHLLLHGAGVAWLLLGVLMQPLPGIAPAAVLLPGYGLLLCGLVLPWLNGLLTASVRNRWDAPSLMVLTALFWLGLSGLYAFGSMLEIFGWSLVILLLVFYPVVIKTVPFLVWRIRCLPLMLDYNQPGTREMVDKRSSWITVLLLLLGSFYLGAGSRLSDPAIIQLGLLSLLVAGVWMLHALWPAIAVFVLGITPHNKEKSAITANIDPDQ